MIGWLIFVGYALVFAVYGQMLTIRFLDRDIRESAPTWDAEMTRRKYLGVDMLAGFGLALFWPVVLPVRTLFRVIADGGMFRTPAEREIEDREELEKLRALAREYGLPLDVTDRKVKP